MYTSQSTNELKTIILSVSFGTVTATPLPVVKLAYVINVASSFVPYNLENWYSEDPVVV
jgi:hypothetical protein